MSKANTTQRQGSRLEIDDPRYCKWCGGELPDVCFKHGFHPLGGDEPPELCGSCQGDALLYGQPKGEIGQ